MTPPLSNTPIPSAPCTHQVTHRPSACSSVFCGMLRISELVFPRASDAWRSEMLVLPHYSLCCPSPPCACGLSLSPTAVLPPLLHSTRNTEDLPRRKTSHPNHKHAQPCWSFPLLGQLRFPVRLRGHQVFTNRSMNTDAQTSMWANSAYR